jgi:outer membrane lipoprotein SlyB
MSDTSNKVSPIVAIASVAVIIFSAVGVGVMTGIIPSSSSKPAEQPAKAEAPAEQPKAAAEAPAPVVKPKVAATPKKPATEPVRVATAEPARAPEPVRAAQVCTACGSVTSVNVVKQQGEGSGLGAVGGAVVGGVLGHQVGSGRGRDVATVVGAGAGAYAGHQIEKNVKSSQSYNVAVRMDDGSMRSFTYPTEPAFRAGDKVKVVDDRLVAN